VTFLARLAAAGVASAEILPLLGTAADCDHAGQEPDVRGRTRTAFADHVVMLAPLLRHSDDDVREAAAYLRERWDREQVPRIRVSLRPGRRRRP
jgi:hypothetical protein